MFVLTFLTLWVTVVGSPAVTVTMETVNKTTFHDKPMHPVTRKPLGLKTEAPVFACPERNSSSSPGTALEMVMPSNHCQAKSVNLMRDSRMGSTPTIKGRSQLFQFVVDSTITTLVIHVNSSRPSTAIVMEPSEELLLEPAETVLMLTSVEFGFRSGRWTFQRPRIGHHHVNCSSSTRYSARSDIEDDFSSAAVFIFPPTDGNNSDKNGVCGRIRKQCPSMIYLEGNFVVKLKLRGEWTLKTPCRFETIGVRGQSCIDFTFEFIDPVLHTRLETMPRPNTSASINIHLLGSQRIAALTRLELRNMSHSLLECVLLHVTDVSIPVLVVDFIMPFESFHFTLVGVDACQYAFQRQNSKLIKPHKFSVYPYEFPPGKLDPTTPYRGRFDIYNMDSKPATFTIQPSFDRLQRYFTARVVPNEVKVMDASGARVDVLIDIQSSITRCHSSTLVLKVTSTSDNSVQCLMRKITACSNVYASDNEPPVCRISSIKGGCASQLPCGSQKWEAVVDVVDALTGVKSARFLNANRSFNNVRFLYSLWNRTAKATYRSDCCTRDFSLRVIDNMKNADTCKFTVPESHVTIPRPRPSVTSPSPEVKTDQKSGVSHTTRHQVIRLNTSKPRGRTSTRDHRRSEHLSTRTMVKTSTLPVPGHRPISSPRTKKPTHANKTLKDHSSWTDTKFSTLRYAAIVLGCVGVVAGLIIVLICVIYVCMRKRWKRHMRRAERHDSNESDFTMGTSQESKSSGSRPDSVRSVISLQVLSGPELSSEFPLRGRTQDRVRPSPRVDSGYFESYEDNYSYISSDGRHSISNKSIKSAHNSEINSESSGSFTPKLSKAGSSYTNMLTVQARFEEMERLASERQKANSHLVRCDHVLDDDARDAGMESQQGYNENSHPRGKDREFNQLSGHGARPKVKKEATIYQGETTHDTDTTQKHQNVSHDHSANARLEARSSHSDYSDSEDDSMRARSYSLVLLKEKQKGTPELYTYRKAALFHNVTIIKTKDGLGLVRSFPARLRAKEDDSKRTKPFTPAPLAGNAKRVRFLSKSTGEMEKDYKEYSREKSDGDDNKEN